MADGPLADASLLTDGHIPAPQAHRPDVTLVQDNHLLYCVEEETDAWLVTDAPVEVRQ